MTVSQRLYVDHGRASQSTRFWSIGPPQTHWLFNLPSTQVCANCTRLRLQCIYKNIIPGIVTRRNHQRASSVITIGSTSSTTAASFPADPPAPDRPDLNFFDTVLRPDEQHRQQIAHLEQHLEQEQSPLIPGPSGSDPGPYSLDVTSSFDMLGFIGEITADFEQKHLDLTNGLSDFPPVTTDGVPSPISHGIGVVPPQPHIWTTAATPSVNESISSDSRTDVIDSPSESVGNSGGIWPDARSSYEEQLVTQFLDGEAPPTIFGPMTLEWRYVRGIIATQSHDCSPLRNSLYCYADLQTARSEGKRWKLAPTYHQQASAEIQACLLGEVGELMLKRIFTAVFLLMLSELIAPAELWRPGTSFLHSAFLLLQRFHRQTKSWTGLSYLIVSWVSLLDVKALIAGRDGDPLTEMGSLAVETPVAVPGSLGVPGPLSRSHADQKSEGLGPDSNSGQPYDSYDSLLSHPGYLMLDAIVGPAFRFFSQAQQVIRRIVCIDLHHRSRGTVSDEFEVLQIAHQVGADLESLWNSRPRVLDVYDRPQDLYDTLRPVVAVEVCRTFRQYLANFLAIFIYLHRVAFAIYPRTDRVHRAVDQIIQLATVESTSRRGHQLLLPSSTSASTPDPSLPQSYTHLPISFIWPLFVAGLEGSLEQRAWIVLEMQRMATGDHDDHGGSTHGTQCHPNADKALLLLEEMTRRQDASRTWADSRCVRRDLFTDPFVMI
ncbi:hypothetical protein FE257_006363 [Aspergillus nanangensis]|uniref:Uncharacterized protein n=1 Tax=Aspergillus nanangensis TaxID=2582783 RepID=A0AAD4CXC6_ASPNN|nr:hypothetical protein FE257_006363 [Aspergillus nanangensis]